MKKCNRSKSKINSAIKEVPAIKELYEQFILKGFTTEQAYGLTITILKLVIK